MWVSLLAADPAAVSAPGLEGLQAAVDQVYREGGQRCVMGTVRMHTHTHTHTDAMSLVNHVYMTHLHS
jgi:hypothetical protein